MIAASFTDWLIIIFWCAFFAVIIYVVLVVAKIWGEIRWEGMKDPEDHKQDLRDWFKF